MMESGLFRPSKIRKRANKACLACRARKVRCDVSQRGRPCMNCFLDSESCVVVDRASRRRKSTEEDANDDAAADFASTEHLQRRGSAMSSGEALEQGDGDARMEVMSDGGSHGPDTLLNATSGFSAANASSSTKRPAVTLSNHSAQREPPQYFHSSTRVRTDHLHWTGEQSTLFGSEVTYSYYSFLEVNNLRTVLPQDVSYLELQGCLRVPKKTILDEFVKHYFLHVHPLMPLINEGDFWETYGSPLAEDSSSSRMSLLLFQAMLFAACAYVSRNTVRALGFSDMKIARAAFYRRAKLMFDFEAESSPIAIAQAAILLSSWSPPIRSHCARTGSFWIGIAIQQAKMAGAHQYNSQYEKYGGTSRPSALYKRRNVLKRLWWCTIVSDRMQSLGAWKPMQVTVLHFSLDNLQDGFSIGEFADEIERSRVYNSEAKKTLIKIFIQMTRLAAVLTELLVVVLPPNEVPQWDEDFGWDEKDRTRKCKYELQCWYDKASPLLPKGPLADSGEHAISEPAAGFAHDSVVLYINFMCLIYNSAMVRLCNYECSRMVAQARRVDVANTALPEKKDIAENRGELQKATQGVVLCLKTLAQNRLTRLLPLDSTASVSLPLFLSIIHVKLSSQPGPALNALHDLYDSVKAYQPQQDTTDWMANSIRHILDLSGLDRQDRSVAPPVGSEGLGACSDDGWLHPSLYLRLAVSWTPDLKGGGFLGERTPADVDIVRVLGSTLLNRIKSDLHRDAQTRRSSSARPSIPASTVEDQTMRNRIAAWQAHDQAVSLELGFDSSDLALAEAEAAGSLEPGPAENEEGAPTWKDAACRAFSAEADAREADLLQAFVFRDQTPGANGFSEAEWPEQQRSHLNLDQEAYSISPETAQDSMGAGYQ